MPDPTVPTPGLTDTDGASLIAAERRRQIEVEGWTPEHDAEHGGTILRRAARCYETHPGDETFVPSAWPWDESWWKPKDHLSNLVRAGALYQAAADTDDDSQHAGLHRDAVARCACKLDGILKSPVVAARVKADRC